MTDYEHVLAVKRANEARLLAIPGVHSVGIGPKITNGQRTGEMSIVVWLPKKKPVDAIPPDQLIPKEIDGVPVDVVENEMPVVSRSGDGTHPAKEDGSCYDPLVGGCRIQLSWDDANGNAVTESGTLGLLAKTKGTLPGIPAGMVVGVTCHHVLYGCKPDAGIGMDVGQPTPQDSSTCCSDIIGRALVGKLVLDCALVALKPKQKYRAEIAEIGVVSAVHEIQPSEIPVSGPDVYRVRKRGFISGLTIGQVVSISHSGTVNDADGNPCHAYSNALAILGTDAASVPYSKPGDSGSAVVNDANQVVGVLFAGSATSSLASHIAEVQSALGIDAVTTQQSGVVLEVPVVANDPIYKLNALQPEIAPSQATTQLLLRAHDEVVQTPAGKELVHVVRRHEDEVRSLINSNRRVAVVWQRNGGPKILQGIFRMVRFPDQRLPAEIEGQSLMERLAAIQRALMRYGSPALSGDLARYVPHLATLGGLTFDELLTTLRTSQAA